MNNQYDTLSEAVEKLKEKGFTGNFRVDEEAKLETPDGEKYSFKDVKVDEFHRFEGISNPADSSIIYAVTTSDGRKGTIVDAYSAKGSKKFTEFVKKAGLY